MSERYWIYGFHAVKAALDNSQRSVYRLVVLDPSHFMDHTRLKKELVDKSFFQKKFGTHAVHQGVALEVGPLRPFHLEDALGDTGDGLILLLDQLTDPHNVGAILRSAAAFGARAVITTDRHAPEVHHPALVKAASGSLEIVPYIKVSNLARTLEELKRHHYWVMGLDERAHAPLNQAPLSGKVALVLGAEGEGLRRLTRDLCDFLFHIPTQREFSTLNVSNAAAISLYAWATHSKGA